MFFIPVNSEEYLVAVGGLFKGEVKLLLVCLAVSVFIVLICGTLCKFFQNSLDPFLRTVKETKRQNLFCIRCAIWAVLLRPWRVPRPNPVSRPPGGTPGWLRPCTATPPAPPTTLATSPAGDTSGKGLLRNYLLKKILLQFTTRFVHVQLSIVVRSVSDPHWFQCGPGSGSSIWG